MFSPGKHGFSPGTPAFSHSPKTWLLGLLSTLMAIRYECVRGWVYVLPVSVLFNDRLSNWPGCTLPLPQRLLGIGTSPHATLPEQAGINNEWMFRWEFYKQVCSFFSPRSIDWRSCFWLCRLLNIDNMNLSKVFLTFLFLLFQLAKQQRLTVQVWTNQHGQIYLKRLLFLLNQLICH